VLDVVVLGIAGTVLRVFAAVQAADARYRGCKTVVFDPFQSAQASKASTRASEICGGACVTPSVRLSRAGVIRPLTGRVARSGPARSNLDPPP